MFQPKQARSCCCVVYLQGHTAWIQDGKKAKKFTLEI
jgi:hypothetical protein